MLRFLRQVRQRLVTDNKFSKYLLYAIGEILLVVIGIMIAISIDNWNQDHLLRKEEQIALQNLKQDFEDNKAALKSNITTTESIIKSNLEVLNYTGSKQKPKTEEAFNVLLNGITMTTEFFAKNSFLDDLLNSGKLGIITDVTLREKLSSWKPTNENIKERERQTISYSGPLLNFIIKNGSWLNADKVSTSPTVQKYAFPESGFDVDNRNLLGHLEFENMVENLIIFHEGVLSSQKTGLKLIEEVLELINKEIKDK